MKQGRKNNKEVKTKIHAMPLKPKASFDNFRNIDQKLAVAVGNLWGMVWGKSDPAIDQKTKLLLSLANAVGAGRIRQAARELIKAYSLGVTVDELDELFMLFIWNQGIGNFASEIGTSVLFKAYQMIKEADTQGVQREQILKKLIEIFGEENPDVSIR
ncbi:MAG: hypothetical protein DRP78_02300 [Candidatus Omnitrophota bacterium]|nr:MAG: hypothetical protein DRP78_02300 [Candidatus Omnitrophota bacterium]